MILSCIAAEVIKEVSLSAKDSLPVWIVEIVTESVVRLPLTFPSTLATNVPVDIVKSPVALGVEVVVPKVNLSALSSHIIAALSPVLPRSMINPESLALEPAPRFNPIILSDTSKLVWFTVVVVPFTVRSPDKVILAPCVVPVRVGAAKVLFDKVT